jgi:hypothetical protein
MFFKVWRERETTKMDFLNFFRQKQGQKPFTGQNFRRISLQWTERDAQSTADTISKLSSTHRMVDTTHAMKPFGFPTGHCFVCFSGFPDIEALDLKCS